MKMAIDMMKANLNDERWATRALLAIYRNQTVDEQMTGETVEDNGIGFTGTDANILSSFAEQVQNGRTLSVKQLVILNKKIGKYAGQLIRMANLR